MFETALGATVTGAQQLLGKVALVTGAGRELGAAICDVLARAGATIVAADDDERAAELTARRLQAFDCEAESLRLDLSDADSAASGVAYVLKNCAGLDILVNIAAGGDRAAIEDLSLEEWDATVSAGLRSAFLLSKLVLPVLKTEGRGDIVHIIPNAQQTAGFATQHTLSSGLAAYSRALQAEIRAYGVRVSTVIAGDVTAAGTASQQATACIAQAVLFALLQPPNTGVQEITVKHA